MDFCEHVFPHTYTEGDELPELVGVLSGVDITSYTVRIRIERPVPSDPLVKDAVLVEPTQGKFKFAWVDTDLVEGLGQLSQIEFEDGGGKVTTGAKFILNVESRFEP
jgi:hypothetical protein